jgi:thiamine-monophosphate kinase
MEQVESTQTVRMLSDVGEKALIRDFIKPFFNASDDPAGVGDDCAIVEFGNEVALFSTDRVPSDLTAFKLGILDYWGLGDYLARLNLSDIAACGGRAVGLLLNLGLPNDIAYENVLAICRGFGSRAEQHGATVFGGDITSACELSISATSVGRTTRGRVLTRRAASPGDSIFVSRPLGMTPAAFHVYLGRHETDISAEALALLRRQFTDMEPLLSLGQALAASGACGACMDNTDGIGQSLTELGEASKCSFVVTGSALEFPEPVRQVGKIIGLSPVDFAFNGGADFSLVGTLRGDWTSEKATERFEHSIQIVGHVEAGQGVWIEDDGPRKTLVFRGWNYFQTQS